MRSSRPVLSLKCVGCPSWCAVSPALGRRPPLYPVACSPQAWSSGAAFMLLGASLGLSIDAPRRRIEFNQPQLPGSTNFLRIQRLQIADTTVDVSIERRARDITCDVCQTRRAISRLSSTALPELSVGARRLGRVLCVIYPRIPIYIGRASFDRRYGIESEL